MIAPFTANVCFQSVIKIYVNNISNLLTVVKKYHLPRKHLFYTKIQIKFRFPLIPCQRPY